MDKLDRFNMVPGFILKLWKMVNDPQCNDLISWSDNGTSFIILDPPRFSQELSKYFKHNNLSSFIRQLNMYGFRKVATIENSGLHPGVDDLHFYHPEFIRGHKDRLGGIKRKLPQKLAETIDLKNVYRGITEIEDRQKDVNKSLSDLRRENEMLWQELHDLRQKHQQQQLYISRLMKLVYEAMEHNGIKPNMLPLGHNPPLMIEGGENMEVSSEMQSSNDLQAGNDMPMGNEMMSVNDMATSNDIANANEIAAANMAVANDIANANEIAAANLAMANDMVAASNLAGTSNLHSQVETAELQIDNLIPTIIDEDLNLDLFRD